MDDLKRCSKCREHKPRSCFTKARAEKDGLYPQCKECRKAYNAANRERQHEYNQAYYAAHKEKLKQNMAQWYQNNRDHHKSRRTAYYRENRDAIMDWFRQYNQTNQGKARKARATHTRRSRIKSTKNTLSHEEWQSIIDEQGYRCARCRRQFSDSLPPTKDHIIPLAKGGGLTKDNVQALCLPCNAHKKDKIIDYRRQQSYGAG